MDGLFWLNTFAPTVKKMSITDEERQFVTAHSETRYENQQQQKKKTEYDISRYINYFKEELNKTARLTWEKKHARLWNQFYFIFCFVLDFWCFLYNTLCWKRSDMC